MSWISNILGRTKPLSTHHMYGLPRWFSGKESACQAGEADSISESGRSPEKEMATNSGVLALEMPWTEEPGRLQFMGSPKSWTQRRD